MKNKFLLRLITVFAFMFIAGAYVARGQNVNTNINVKTQAQIQNQNQVRAQVHVGTDNNTATSAQRRSQVANAVQAMLLVADRTGGIGEQVRVIARNQNQNQEEINASLNKVQNRNKTAKFFIGANYKELNNAQKLLEQNKVQLQKLMELKAEIQNEGDLQVLENQIQLLNQVNAQIQNELNSENQGFSLLGWLFKRFSK